MDRASFQSTRHASSRRNLSCDYFAANIRIEVALDSVGNGEQEETDECIKGSRLSFRALYERSSISPNYLFNYTD